MKKILVFVLSLLLVPSLSANTFVEGKHYEVLALTASEKPVVEEFFSFYCPHCAQFAPVVNQLKTELPAGVNLEKYHVGFIGGEMGREMQLAFAASEILNVEAKIEHNLFDALHNKKEKISSRNDIKGFFEKNGIAGKDFDASVASFVATGMAEAMDKKTMEYKITGVPSVIVNGKYKVNSGSIKSIVEYNALVNYLVSLK